MRGLDGNRALAGRHFQLATLSLDAREADGRMRKFDLT
jgi:hypothetical protein